MCLRHAAHHPNPVISQKYAAEIYQLMGVEHESNGAASKVLLAGLPNGKWHDLNLFREVIGGCEVAISFHEHSSDEQNQVARRDYLCHPLWHYSFPVRTADQIR
jgi:hypothetical protein